MLKKQSKRIPAIIYKAMLSTIDNDGVEHAGYLAFLFLLSLFPFLVFFFAIAGNTGQSELGSKLVSVVLDSNLLTDNVLKAVKPRIDEIVSGPPQGLLTIAIIGSIWTASSSVEGLRTILNRAYRVETPPTYIIRRLLSIGQFLILTAIIIGVTILLIVIPNVWKMFNETVSLSFVESVKNFFFHSDKRVFIPKLWNYVRYAVTALTAFVFVSVVYYSLPNIKQKWKNVIPGAFIVVLLWFLSANFLTSYVKNFEQLNIIYGSLGGIITSLIFFYIAALILIYGAELNYLLGKNIGVEPKPKKDVQKKT